MANHQQPSSPIKFTCPKCHIIFAPTPQTGIRPTDPIRCPYCASTLVPCHEKSKLKRGTL